ncbi:MAG TPA: DNA polymerase III subunit alpha [Candidatus Kapabacteria bacterium]|nr:DNA polymerase III subunit alpha [Candidatus Kapabacteria bacterium]
MDEKLINWLENNRLDFQKEDNLVEIREVGKFYVLQPKDKVILKDFMLNITKDEWGEIYNIEADFVLFEFGGLFYYSRIDKDGEDWKVVLELKDLRSLGKARQEFDYSFSHLGIHSEYELLNGSRVLKDWAKKAKFWGHKAIGICDKNTLAGTVALQLACNDFGLQPIFGETITILYDRLTKDETFELKLYVRNSTGWDNLLQINKIINIDNGGFIREDELLQHSKGLIAVFSKESLLNDKDINVCKEYIKKYKNSFDRVYYQIDTVVYSTLNYERKKLENFKRYFNQLIRYIEPILINDSYYIDQVDHNVKKRLNLVSGKSTPISNNQHYKCLDESIELLNELFNPEKVFSTGENYYGILLRMVENVDSIINDCNFEIAIGEHKLPAFEGIKDNETMFEELLVGGWVEKIQGKVNDETLYMERLEKESKLIIDCGFVDYFLILWDIVKWAKSNNILVGPARGSVAGSLVAYVLDITTIDPIKYDLLFERFMNETRFTKERASTYDSLPDVDIDFQSSKRDEIKRYIENKYGVKYSASIGTYTRMKLRGAMKDFGRAEGHLNFSYMNFITSKIEEQGEYGWEDIFKLSLQSEDLKKFVQNNFDLINDLKYCLGQVRAASIHASAVLIVPKFDSLKNKKNIFNWVPVRKVLDKKQEVLITEWEGKFIDRTGFLKEDILGISQLDKFQMILKLIKKNTGDSIILENIPLDDPKVYGLFKKGYNEEVFQFGTIGIKKYSKVVRPDNIDDLIAMNALYRPGPKSSNAHLDYASIKHGKKKAVYDYGLKKVTESTYGLYIYQEQIMQAVHILGGLSLVDADNIRTMMKHFLREEMAVYENKFVDGAVKNGCEKSEAEKIWKKLLAFSGYGFNKSHSTAYAIIAYQCQWLKCYYPLEFYTTALSFADIEIDIPNIITEIKNRKLRISVKPPEINESSYSFECNKNDNSIYWSLISVKGVGEATIRPIFEERLKRKFNSLLDFMERMRGKGIKRNTIESLILAGCFDNLEKITNEKDRIILLEQLAKFNSIQVSEEYKKSKYNRNYTWILSQKSISGFGELPFRDILNSYDRRLTKLFIEPNLFLVGKNDYKNSLVVGFLVSIRERKSKRGKFAELLVKCNYESLYVTCWSDVYLENKKQLEKIKKEETLFIITGKIKFDDYKGMNVLYTQETTKIYEL